MRPFTALPQAIAEQPIELLKHVGPTLDELRSRHRLLLVTKGNVAEQTGKVERSGLKPYFEAVEVVAEKNARELSRHRREIRAGAEHDLDGRQQSEVRH